MAALAGDTLVHGDIRADNLLITTSADPTANTRKGRDGAGSRSGDHSAVMVVDWPHAAQGVAWFDRVLLLINVRLYGGHDTQALLAELALRAGADLDDLGAVLVGCAGYFADAARLSPPIGLPTARAFQHAQAEAVISWLAEIDFAGRPTRCD